MSLVSTVILILLSLLLPSVAYTQEYELENQAYIPHQLDISTQLGLDQALAGYPDNIDKQKASEWILKASKRLQKKIPNLFYRLELLGITYREAQINQIQADFVLAVIEVESQFNRNAISHRDARGLMQVMPFWISELGQPEDNLFNPETNIIYGCKILQRYIKRADGDLNNALSLYLGSPQQVEYAKKVFLALEKNQPQP